MEEGGESFRGREGAEGPHHEGQGMAYISWSQKNPVWEGASIPDGNLSLLIWEVG